MLLSTSIVLVPDWTVAVQLLIFLVVLSVVVPFLLRPLLRVRDLRREATVAAQARAEELGRMAQEQAAEYERRLRAARLEGLAAKERLRQEGYAGASEIMGRARAAALQQLEGAKTQLMKAAAAARDLLEANAGEFARAITERILERAIGEQVPSVVRTDEEGRGRTSQRN